MWAQLGSTNHRGRLVEYRSKIMSFLCWCCLKPNAAADTNGGLPQTDIEVARAADDNFRLDELPAESSSHEIRDDDASSVGSRSAHCSQLSHAAGASSGCRVCWGNRCGLAEGASQDSLAYDSGNFEDDADDSYDEEMTKRANASVVNMPPTQYIPYPEGDPNSSTNPPASKNIDLLALALRTERAGFLARKSAFADSALVRINEERQRHGSQPLQTRQELELLAEQLWKDLAQIPDGFAVVPRCVYFPRGFKRGERFGCLTYYTPRSARAGDCVPDAMVHFWRNAGVSRKPVEGASEQSATIAFRTNARSDFPAAGAGETYVADKTSAVARAFDKYRKYFPAQLLTGGCHFMGLHADMVQLVKDNSCNVICVAVVFDYVANRKGREMRSPIEK